MTWTLTSFLEDIFVEVNGGSNDKEDPCAVCTPASFCAPDGNLVEVSVGWNDKEEDFVGDAALGGDVWAV